MRARLCVFVRVCVCARIITGSMSVAAEIQEFLLQAIIEGAGAADSVPWAIATGSKHFLNDNVPLLTTH